MPYFSLLSNSASDDEMQGKLCKEGTNFSDIHPFRQEWHVLQLPKNPSIRPRFLDITISHLIV
jgi:hypothetical protein